MIHNVKSSTLSNICTTIFKLVSRFKFVNSLMLPYLQSHQLMVCNSFTCLPAFDVIYFQRFPCGSSHTDSNDPHRTWEKDFVNESDRFSLVGTLSTFKRPSCTAYCSHKKRMSTCRVFLSLSSGHACSTAIATHVNLAYHCVMPIVQHCLDSERMT